MLKSIYTPLSGAIAQEKTLEIIANNLANVNTIGFKGEAVTFKLLEPEPYRNYKDPLPPANYKIPFEELLPFHGNEVNYVGVSGIHRDFTQGSPVETKNPLDLMIEGKGFFAFHTQDGMRYGRAGTLTLNQDGALVDKNGFPLIGEKGNIFLHGKDISINPSGEIWQDGQYMDKIQIFSFRNPEQLEKTGLNHFFYDGPDDGRELLKNPVIRQGYLESSNVNAIKNLTNMILAHRSFEAYQQAVKHYDNMMEKSNNTLGEVRA
ncbi:MAG: flagellar hook-basal body protein [Deltaproteobacteria bacterium]|nr:flagellar hook-basal body protein [Deltaproteobacteria bacterium]